MKWLRGVLAVAVGYIVSQGLNGVFVYFWYFGERSLGTPVLAVLTAAFLGVVALVAGYLTGRVAAPNGKMAGLATAGLIVAVTIGNIVVDVAAEPMWHKILVIVVMAPIVAAAAARFSPPTSTTEPAPSSDA